MQWPLSVKHAAKITSAQWKCRIFRSINYPAQEKNFIGRSNIFAWGKSRVGFPFIAPIDLAHIYFTPSFPSPSVAVHSERKRYLGAVNCGRQKWIWTLFYAVFPLVIGKCIRILDQVSKIRRFHSIPFEFQGFENRPQICFLPSRILHCKPILRVLSLLVCGL